MNTTAALKKTKKQLHESGFKLTPQREATLLVLLENEKDHLSAEEISFLCEKKILRLAWQPSIEHWRS